MNLIDVLIEKYDYTHKKAKTLLTNGFILVNNKIVTKYNFIINDSDIITIKSFNTNAIDDIEILYEDKNIIVLNKPAGLLTIASLKEKEKTLYHIVSNYVKDRNKKAKIFIIHRLDKDTSGIVMFAKSENVKKMYQDNWDSLVIYRGYVAVVEGIFKEKEKTINIKLKDEDNFKVYVDNRGKEAITSYKVIKENNNYSLLDIEIKTGRKNQIRVTMEYLNHPIIGDKKYSSNDNSIKRLALHAYKLHITNPITKEIMKFELKIPKEFNNVIK